MFYAFLMMIIVRKPCYVVMNHMFHLTIAFSSCFMYLFAYTLYLYPHHELMVQAISDRWVRTRTGDFTQDVPESSNACTGVATNEHRNAARGTPLPPPPPVSLEHLLATQNELMRVLTENLV
jgi:hypothetical protein